MITDILLKLLTIYQIALAPLSTFAHAAIEVLRVFAPWVDYLKVKGKLPVALTINNNLIFSQRALDFMGVYGWFDTDGLGDQIFKSFCEQTRTQAQFCIDYFYNIFVGPSKNLDPVKYYKIRFSLNK